jgi:ribosomal protein L11 methyltransferase
MPYLALSFELQDLDAQHAEDSCLAAGALAITLSDARDEAVLEPAPGEVRLWNATRLQALFAADASPAELSAQLVAALGLPATRLAFAPVADRAWEREWLRDFHAMQFGRRLWVCPHHEQVQQPGAVVVRLDPGLAFGTGTHASTALCLQWLDGQQLAGARVIDYGCGSGILGLAAAALGAARIDAFDIDAQALLATTENAAANGAGARVHAHHDAAGLPSGADVLVANILAATLCSLASDFARLVRTGGSLVLAGILAEQADAVTAVYAPWFDIVPVGTREGWVALAGSRLARAS